MASPFTVFRKYQAAFLAVFGVVIIIVFTIGDSLSRMVGGGGQRDDSVALLWDGEELTEGDLFRMRDVRAAVGYMLERLQRQALQRGAFGQQAAMAMQFGFPLPVQPIISEASLTPGGTVQVALMARKAEKLGFMVTDAEISRYLFSLVDDKLDETELRGAISGPSGRLSVRAVYDVLRQEMLADKLFNEFSRGSLAPTAGQQLDYYSRLNRRIQLEMITMPASAFLSEVEAPTDEQLEEFFDRHKSVIQPVDMVGDQTYISPQPGFKLPMRVSVEYVSGHIDDLMDTIREEITEDEIRIYYDENKDVDTMLQVEEDLELPDVDQPGGDSSETQPEDDNKSDTTDVPLEGDSEDGATSSDGDSSTDVQPDRNTPPDAVKSPKADDDASYEYLRDIVGVCEEEDELGDEKEQPSDADDEEPAESAEAAPAGAEDSSKDGDEAATSESAPEKPEGSQSDEEPEKKKPTYKPFEEVRDQIHQLLTRQRALERLDEKFQTVKAKMDAYHQARIYAEEGEEPTYRRPNLKAVAEQLGLRYGKHELLSARAFLEDTRIGKSEKQVPATAQNQYPQPVPFVRMAFREGEQSLFNPMETFGEGDRFLFWKTDEKEQTVPQLDEVKDEVVRAWKIGAGRTDEDATTARKLARRWADAAAAEIRAGKPMSKAAETRAEAELVETAFFNFLTAGSAPAVNFWQPPPLRLSSVTGVDQAGPEFMRTVFALELDEVGVASNHPQTHVYVVRVKDENKSDETLEENFLDDLADPRVTRQIQQAAQFEWQLVQQQWLEELNDEFDVTWLKPDLRYRR